MNEKQIEEITKRAVMAKWRSAWSKAEWKEWRRTRPDNDHGDYRMIKVGEVRLFIGRHQDEDQDNRDKNYTLLVGCTMYPVIKARLRARTREKAQKEALEKFIKFLEKTLNKAKERKGGLDERN